VARYFALLILTSLFAVAGYFLFGTVVAIYAGLWLHNEKMYFAQGTPAHVFGTAGATAGALLAWGIWRLQLAFISQKRPYVAAVLAVIGLALVLASIATIALVLQR